MPGRLALLVQRRVRVGRLRLELAPVGQHHAVVLVFSMCGELGYIASSGRMNWDKMSVMRFDVRNYREISPQHIARNILCQSSRWNEWNRLQLV